jgi:outer membrane lipoprotein carrier protein
MKKIIAWAFVAGLAAGARSATLEEVMARLEQAEKQVKTLRFDFSQTTTLTHSRQTMANRGAASFQRPNRFRVEQSAPEAQTVVSDGKSLWFYLPARGQVIRDSMDNWSRSAGFPQGLTPFQMTVGAMKARYDWTLEDGGDTPVLRLAPKEGGAPYTLRLWVDMETGLARRTELSAESVTAVVEITRVKVNPALAPSAFRFVPPEGTDVLDMPFK